MLATRTSQTIANPLPSSFAGMMELYENNYIAIRHLCGELKRISDCLTACPDPEVHPELVLRVLQRSPYTVTLQFYYSNGYHNASTHLPSTYVRIYFDARQAEARGQLDSFSTGCGVSLKQRWEDNLLLFKWLSYWRRQGYSFLAA